MCATPKSTIAQLLFIRHPLPNFAQLVGELDTALERCPAEARSLVWDCDDVVVFELDEMRIVLGHSDTPGNGYLSCLTIAVGLSESDGEDSPLTRRHDGLCRLIVERVQQRYPVEAILWHEAAAPITSDTLDALLDALPNRTDLDRLQIDIGPAATATPDAAPTARPAMAPAAAAEPDNTATMAKPVANDLPDLPRLRHDDLHRMRLALYPEEAPGYIAPPDQGALARRLTVHAMNTTLIMVSLPVGAALLTYSVLRGEDMRVTGRAMALTGITLGLMQSPFGAQIMAMI
ncbi:MAG: hypothetical protein Q8P60_04730 [Pseudorhodobacter sp.]|nr:hypothetical protein [Pseudorhodobacter sp.]